MVSGSCALESCEPLSHSPGSVLQVRMRQTSLISAHLAAHIHKHTIFAPGLGHVAASGTVVQEMSHCYDQYLQLSYLSVLIHRLASRCLFAGKVNSLEATSDGLWARRVVDILAGFGDYCRRYPLTWVRVPASPLLLCDYAVNCSMPPSFYIRSKRKILD